MAKSNPKKLSKESDKAVMAGVRKEMARPRVAESARNKKSDTLTLSKLFTHTAPHPR
jgi:hypothetical protein